MKLNLLLCFFLFTAIFNCADATTDSSLVFQDPVIDLSRYVSTFEDNSHQFNEITVLNEKFSPLEQNQANFGYSESTHWLKAEITATRTERVLLQIANPRLDKLDFFLYAENGKSINTIHTGDLNPFSERQFQHHHFIFPIQFEAGKSYFFLIKVKEVENLFLPLYLWQEAAFYQNDSINAFLYGFFYGTLGLIIVINLLIYANLGDLNYLQLSLFIIFFALSLFVLNGLASRFLWGNSIWWAKQCLTFFQSWALFFGLIFARSFLNTKYYAGIMDRLLLLLICTAFLTGLMSILMPYKWSLMVMSHLSLMVPVIVLISAYRCLFKGFQPAKFFLIAWHVFLVGVIAYGLMLQQLLPSNNFTQYGMHFGLMWVAVWLYLALFYRFNLLKKEKEQAQYNTIKQQSYTLNYQKKVMSSISRFVPMQFLNLLEKVDITDVRYGDAKLKNMVIMFTDIREYTTLVESMPPEENLEFLNSYMKFMQPVIEKNHGFIDKFIGDGIMALFPESADNALQAAIDMQLQLDEFNQLRYQKGLNEIKIGIGIHGGDVMLGTVGSDSRLDTTVIGDAVNLTSRLENLTKDRQIPIIISKYIYQSLIEPHKFAIEELKGAVIRGKSGTVDIFQVRLEGTS